MAFRLSKSIDEPVVITGFGCLTPLGNSRAAFWEGLQSAHSGVSRIEAFDPAGLPVQIAGEVRNVDPLSAFATKERQHVSRTAGLAVLAARQAVADARLECAAMSSAARRRLGVVIGSGGGGLEFTERQYARYFRGAHRQASVYSIPASTTGGLSSEVAMDLGTNGPSHVISTGCTSSTDAIFYASQWVRSGRVDQVITGGVDAPVAPGILSGFCLMRILSESGNDNPERASRPFNRDRDGFVLGEGAWMFVLERLSSALSRGVRPYAEVLGYGSTCDAHHRVRLDESGIEPARAIELALEDAGVSSAEVDAVNLHGTATLLNDRIETRAIKLALGAAAGRIPMSSTKSAIGHPQGASGAAGVGSLLLTLAEGVLPPTLNLTDPDPECDLDYVPLTARRVQARVVVANCIGFGSKNSALVLGAVGH